jgi:hypothetical protein
MWAHELLLVYAKSVPLATVANDALGRGTPGLRRNLYIGLPIGAIAAFERIERLTLDPFRFYRSYVRLVFRSFYEAKFSPRFYPR